MKHIETHEKLTRKCRNCCSILRLTETALKEHFWMCTKFDSRRYKPLYKQKVTPESKDEKEENTKTSEEMLVYPCTMCDFHSQYEASLKRHMTKFHGGAQIPDEESFKCDICERPFHSYAGLSKHKKFHAFISNQ